MCSNASCDNRRTIATFEQTEDSRVPLVFGNVRDHLRQPGIGLILQAQSANRIASVRVESGTNDNQIGLASCGRFLQRWLKRAKIGEFLGAWR